MTSIDDVQDISPRDQYVASAAQTDFDYSFPIFTQADLTIYVDDVLQVLTTDYTVAGAGEETGGTVTFVNPMTGGEVVTIYRDIAIARNTDVQQNGPWSSTSYNDEMDKVFLIMQELENKIGRAIRFPLTAAITNAQALLDPLSTYAGKFLRITSAGLLEAAEALDNTVTLSAEIIGQLLYPQSAAEIAISVTPTAYKIPWFQGARYGLSESNSAATNTANFHDLVNVARNARRQIVELDEGVFDMQGPAFLVHDDTYNDVAPSDARSQRMTVRGKGMGSFTNYHNSEPYGTYLNFTNETGDGLVVADGTQHHGMGLMDLAVVKPLLGAFTGALVKMDTCPTHTFLERVLIGGGKMATPGSCALFLRNIYTHSKLKQVHVAGHNTDKAGTGILWGTQGVAGDLFTIDGLSSMYWDDAAIFGMDFDFDNFVFNTLKFKDFQFSRSVRGLTMKHGMRQLFASYGHFEQNEEYDIKVFHSAGRDNHEPDTLAGLLHFAEISLSVIGDGGSNIILGDDAGTDDENGYGNVLLDRMAWNQVSSNRFGVRRYMGPTAGYYKERDCRWDYNSGYARVIDDVDQVEMEVINPNYDGTTNTFPATRRLVRASDLADLRHRGTYYDPPETLQIASSTDLSAQTVLPPVIFLNTGAGNVTLTIPAIANEYQRPVAIRMQTGTNEGTIDAGAGKTFRDRSRTITLYAQSDVVVIGPDSSSGTDWTVLSEGGFPSQTSTQLNAIAGSINTSGKYAGRKVWNTTVDHFVWAEGGAAADVWVDGSGNTINTPA